MKCGIAAGVAGRLKDVGRLLELVNDPQGHPLLPGKGSFDPSAALHVARAPGPDGRHRRVFGVVAGGDCAATDPSGFQAGGWWQGGCMPHEGSAMCGPHDARFEAVRHVLRFRGGGKGQWSSCLRFFGRSGILC